MDNLPVKQESSLFFEVDRFEHAQRIIKMLSTSTLIPDAFRGNPGNCLIALNYAERLNCDPIMLMQKMYIIKGRPGVEAQLKIALVNNCGRFSPLKWKHEGADTPEWKCTAYAQDKVSGELLEFTLDWKTVKSERWLDKTGSKWKTMPRKMMQYRSGAWWADLYCPEVTLGLPTKDELQDAVEIEPITVSTPDLELKILGPSEPTGENEFVCQECGFEGASKRGLAKHMTQSHPPEENVTMITDEQIQRLESFLPPEQLTEFLTWYHGDKKGGWDTTTKLDADKLILNFDEEYEQYKTEIMGED